MLKKPPKRVSYREREEIIDLPNLIEIQIKSYNQFLQVHLLPHERENIGLQEVFNEIFPIKSYDEKTVLEYLSYNLGVPKYSPEECIRRGITYNVTLKVKFRLTDETGIKEEEVYMGTIPVMTDKGTFIVNGAERVIVSQLHRSPGISYEQERHPKGTMIYSFRIIPYRGSWLEASFDTNDLIYIYIDRKKRRRKILASTFIRTLGYSTDSDILEEFFETVKVKIKSEKDFVKLVGKILAEDVVDEQTGLVFGKASEKLTTAMLKRMVDEGIQAVRIAEEADETHPVIKMLSKDTTDSYESALKDFYRKIRPGEPPTLSNARSAIMRLFFDPKRYNLGRVGRYKLNRKLGMETKDEDLTVVTLRKEDVIAALKYVIRLKMGDEHAHVDDIDHLGNRRVRSVGELLENQFRLGLVRMERSIKERMNLLDMETVLPHDLINAKPVVAAVKEFFSSSQLSQFMDQTNPLAEITHKRRLSALGPGGLTRERAGFEVRDVHPSHYSRICPIETPEGPNIGLITSLATYARINKFGFIEAPYRKVVKGRVTDEIEFLSAIEGDKYIIAQANSKVDASGRLVSETISARAAGDFVTATSDKIEYMDVSPKQVVSVATALVPFLEHDDANRALMGSNMQRQAVPLLKSEAPLVGTGMETVVARDSGYVVQARRAGVVESVDATRIVVRADSKEGRKRNDAGLDVYDLIKFQRSNQSTTITQTPVVRLGQPVKVGQVLADGPAIDHGELALGKNILVAFMPWGGYNFEDAILLSEKLVREDAFTSIHIEEFEVEARDTKLGKEDITRDIPNVGEEALRDLDESGIIRIGAEVKPGNILVGKVTPKGETQLTPEEKLLRAIFGEKAGDVKDTSLTVPPGVEGIVVDVKIFSRKGLDKDERSKSIESEDAMKLQRDHHEELRIIDEEKTKKIRKLLLGKVVGRDLMDPESGDVILKKKGKLTAEILKRLPDETVRYIILSDPDEQKELEDVERRAKEQIEILQTLYDEKVGRLKRGDELPPGVIKLVKVYVSMKRKIQVGDKMAGRHGNKGVVSRILPEEDMPCLPDGTPVEIVLNPLGVPSRMNVGQILETHLGWAAKALGIKVASPVFDGASETEIKELLKKANLPTSGQTMLMDGRTGEMFGSPVTVGYMYVLKLHHLVDDKIHARSIGPYSLVTQQPLGGKAQFGGQRLGEMEVWALQAYGAASTLQEFLTVKSDDVPGRSRMYEAIVKGEPFLEPGLPESFNVLVKELQSLGLDVELIKSQD